MHFDSFAAFIDMGGYGFYVWTSFIVTFVGIYTLFIEQKWRKKQLKLAVVKENDRIQRIKKAKEKASQANSDE